MSSQLYIGNDLSAVPSVVIEKIVPMPLSVQYKKDASGKLLKPDNELDITGVTGITDIDNYILQGKYSGSNIDHFDFNTLVRLSGIYACEKAYQNCAKLTNIDLGSLTTISGNYACQYMFSGCTGITSVNLGSLTTINGNGCCNRMFTNCNKITNLDLKNLTTIINGTNTCAYMFQYCSGITGHLDLSSLKTISGYAPCEYMFQGCSNITSVDLSGLTSIGSSYILNDMFRDCVNLVSVDLSSLTSVTGQSMERLFQGCSKLTTIDLSSLSKITGGIVCSYMFRDCTSLKILSFPSLTSTSFGSETNQLNNMIYGCTDVTIHFPSNLEQKIQTMTGYPNFGGTETVLLYDLPATE